jgi:Fe(3+) dicitrate transport protein
MFFPTLIFHNFEQQTIIYSLLRLIKYIVTFCTLAYGFCPYLYSQQASLPSLNHVIEQDSSIHDTLRFQQLDINVMPYLQSTLPDISGAAASGLAFSTMNLVGHAAQQIDVQKKSFHIAEKTGRQLFSEIPGAMIYDMDGSGNQVNMAIRGLDPHRSWEFNIRQNGLVTNSDIYGYPASHYSMPLEAIQSIEIAKGTAALQYGAQFGGMINYTLKSPSLKKIHYEGQHNTGSFGLLSTYHSLSGTLGKVQYFSYIHYRQSSGYRDNAESKASAFHGRIIYTPNSRLSITAELSNSQYLYHVPGPLGLEQFLSNPQQSSRSRNYFQPNIYLPGITIQYRPNSLSTLSFVISSILGQRNSVLFEGFSNKKDTINALTNSFANRTVDIDQFHSYTSELRYKRLYYLGNFRSSLAVGLRGFNNTMWRRQLGEGTTGSDFDLTVEPNSFKRDLKYHSQSLAFSLENAFYLTKQWSLSPGFRYEIGNTDAYGTISYLPSDSIPRRIDHRLPALGLATEYRSRSNNGVLSGGICQAHRPVIFKDIIPGSSLERTAQNLQDARGYNAEIGYQRTLGNHWFIPTTHEGHKGGLQKLSLQYTITAFQTQYNHRMGNWVLFDSVNAVNYIRKTNIGNSRTRGIECLLKFSVHNAKRKQIVSITSATALQQAKYQQATAAISGKNVDISGNFVEGVPTVIQRTQATYNGEHIQFSILHSFVGSQFSDAVNTVNINSNGSIGKVPSYGLIDINFIYSLSEHFQIRGGVNNLLNRSYYTKHPTMYPGPGIWPSDGRGASIGLNLSF